MKAFRLSLLALATCLWFVMPGHAQGMASGLTLGLLERYLSALRLDFGIPGLTAALVDDGQVWERGFGLADVAANIAATPSTPYPIAGLTQAIGGTLALSTCIDSGRSTLTDRVIRWTPFAEPDATIAHVLAHVSPQGSFRYEPSRFAVLGDVAAECGNGTFEELLAGDVLDRLAMVDSVPGRDVLDDSRRRSFSDAQLARYQNALLRMAVPYRLDANRTATRSDYTINGVSAATGLISTVRDLARFDAALEDGVLLSEPLLQTASNAAPGRPTGFGWFVQHYNGQRVVWQFGRVTGAYSSLIVRIPDRRLTLILLANSDTLAAALDPQAPDVTQSLFARTFLRLFIS